MRKTGAWLARYALEQLPISHTFGIPGVHNTELYDELSKSDSITPILVTHESGASFMADGISRTSNQIGTLLIVPAAGLTHAMSGIAEAFLDGVPMLVITGGIRTDVDKSYQLHEIDQMAMAKSITKYCAKVTDYDKIIPTIFEAYNAATSGEPGPALIEIPVNLQLFKGETNELPKYSAQQKVYSPDTNKIKQAADVISAAKKVAIFSGWGARGATKALIDLAEHLGAPVSTTLQGLSSFPGNHALHTGMGFGEAAVPAATNAFKDIDCLIAVGTRFSEIPTGSFGITVPEKLIHIDINAQVFDKNYKSVVAIEADANLAVSALLEVVKEKSATKENTELKKSIKQDKENYYKEWLAHKSDRVNPYRFFKELRSKIDDNDFMVVDDGNHTFLAAELFEVRSSGRFISPTDFNCMGYCVPAAIGTKLVNPKHRVIGLAGDGAFLMTGLEILTATELELGIVYFIFADGELSQISQGQEIPYNRKTCTVLPEAQFQGIAQATGADFFSIKTNDEISSVIDEALAAADKKPVIVEVKVDYSKRTRFTEGVVKTVLGRFPTADKFRFIGRALLRKITG